MCVAAERGHLDMVEWLIAAGADVNFVSPIDGSTRTALYIAAQHGHRDVVVRLIATPGLNVNLVGNSGATPLYITAQYGRPDVV